MKNFLTVAMCWLGLAMMLIGSLIILIKGIIMEWDHALSIKDKLSFWPYILIMIVGAALVKKSMKL